MLETSDLPQANSLHNVIATIIYVEKGARTYQNITRGIEKSTGNSYDDRQGRYYRDAAELIGMIEPRGNNNSVITDKGKQLLSLPPATQKIFLASAIINCKAMKLVFNFIKATPRCTKEMIADLLQTNGITSYDMAVRRTSTIMKWFYDLRMVKNEGNYYTAQWEPSFEGTVLTTIESVEAESKSDLLISGILKEFDGAWDGSMSSSENGSIHFHVNLQARERASKAHQNLIKRMAGILSTKGIVPLSNRFIDLYAKVNDTEYIMEMKSCTDENIASQIRRGISQLYEYRFRHNINNPSLWLVLENPPTKENHWYLQYLLQDRGINVCWADEADSFTAPDECKVELEELIKSKIHKHQYKPQTPFL